MGQDPRFQSLPLGRPKPSKASSARYDLVPVPAWLWSLAAHLYESRELWRRAAGLGLLANRVVEDEEEHRFLRETFEPWYIEWACALRIDELDELERTMRAQVSHMHEWLGRLVRDRFPEGELVAFACARETLEGACCVLEARGRVSTVNEVFERLDQDVSDAIVAYSDPANEPERNIFVRRTAPLLHLARNRGILCWWGILADPSPRSI